jgi:multidrug efflux pump subunit AcrA (membrane-fusion protein)
LAPINSSIISSGEIILTSNKKIISHLEGGVIDKIKIQEGQFVHEGEDLIALNTVQVQSRIVQISESIHDCIH